MAEYDNPVAAIVRASEPRKVTAADPDRLGPLADRVVILPDAEDTRVGTMDKPETQTERAQSGRVVAVGPGRVTETGHRLPMTLRPGDRVSFPSYAGHDLFLALDGVTRLYRIAREDELAYNHGPLEDPLE